MEKGGLPIRIAGSPFDFDDLPEWKKETIAAWVIRLLAEEGKHDLTGGIKKAGRR